MGNSIEVGMVSEKGIHQFWTNLLAGPPSRFAGLSRGKAWIVLSGVVILLGWGLYDSTSIASWTLGTAAFVDEDLFRTIVERTGNGEGYYHAQGDYFRSNNIATTSTLN